MTPRFTEKLDALPDTLARMRTFDPAALRLALQRAADRSVVAVGAGGSYIAASYLAACRRTLGHGPTIVQTPMEVVLDLTFLGGQEVWIFSASANNADAAAAARAARDRGCATITICTRNPEGAVARWTEAHGGGVISVPVADGKDGYLATHSLLATVAGLLVASNGLLDVEEVGDGLAALEAGLEVMLNAAARRDRREAVKGLTSGSTVVAIIDPRLAPLRTLLETSVWESALCAIQVTDMRNFAHGRHAWLHHHGEQTWVFGAVGDLSKESWNTICTNLPSAIPMIEADYGACSRTECAIALVDGLGWVEAMGASVGIDPGKPGIAASARTIYEDASLRDVACRLPAPVRQKLAVAARAGGRMPDAQHAASAWSRHVNGVCAEAIGGLVLDYDGTVVTTEARFDPADAAIVAELVRLHCSGLIIAFASGRGKSLGNDLRRVLPPAMARDTLVGYYNGGHIRTASVDIAGPEERPVSDPVIGAAADWLREQPDLLRRAALDVTEIQIAVRMSDLMRPQAFVRDLQNCPLVAEGRIKVVRSAHSYDILPARSSKLKVVDVVADRVGSGRAVLSVGDSGGAMGNDYALLKRAFGLSVGVVCDDLDGSWSLYGSTLTGPAALLRILRGMIVDASGQIRLDRRGLGLDELCKVQHIE